uniref:Uncharacterized protein n=1 Tax=Physcomitrium patens TaxID=3218 RepID=A0A2K1IP98_PHYPA|nr:hypothetical protein PHYPA_027421 [Physcomitrium patens]
MVHQIYAHTSIYQTSQTTIPDQDFRCNGGLKYRPQNCCKQLPHLKGFSDLLARRRPIAIYSLCVVQRIVLDKIVHHGLEVVTLIATVARWHCGHCGSCRRCAQVSHAQIIVPQFEPLGWAKHCLPGGCRPSCNKAPDCDKVCSRAVCTWRQVCVSCPLQACEEGDGGQCRHSKSREPSMRGFFLL